MSNQDLCKEETVLLEALDESILLLGQLIQKFKINYKEKHVSVKNGCDEHFAVLINRIESRGEDLKCQIDQCVVKMIEQTKKIKDLYLDGLNKACLSDETIEEDYKKLEEKRKLLNRLIENKDVALIKNAYNLLIEFLNETKFKQREKIIEFSTYLNNLDMVKNNLINFNKFEPNLCFMFDRICLGSLWLGDYSKEILNSNILDTKQAEDLIKLCEFSWPKNETWKLLYRATEHGFGAESFHSKCDGYRNTLTVVETQSGLPHVFGGFTSEAWSSLGEWKSDPGAFLFSLINKRNKPVKIKVSEERRLKKFKNDAIYCSANYGPTFGRGHDLFIASNSNRSDNSFSYLGYTFKHEKFAQGSNEAKTLLAGSLNFTVNEIEVYAKN
jgi:hypothetical protein